MSVIEKSTLPNLIYRGKIRDTHDVGNDVLLMVATDRISAYDVVLPTAIPGCSRGGYRGGASIQHLRHLLLDSTI